MLIRRHFHKQQQKFRLRSENKQLFYIERQCYLSGPQDKGQLCQEAHQSPNCCQPVRIVHGRTAAGHKASFSPHSPARPALCDHINKALKRWAAELSRRLHKLQIQTILSLCRLLEIIIQYDFSHLLIRRVVS